MSRGKCIILNYFVWYNAPMNAEWTTEYPKEPGYYWVRNSRWDEYSKWKQWNDTHQDWPRVVTVTPFLSFYYAGCEYRCEKADLVSAEWLGPIQPPQDKINTRATALGVFLGADKLDSRKE